MQRILLLVGLIATGLVAAPSAAAQQACAVGSTLQFSPVSGQSQCAMAPGAFTLAPGQLFLGGPIMTRPDFYTGGLYGTSSYGSGGASVRPGGWFPQVAGAPMNAAQTGAFLSTGVSNIGLGLPSNPGGLPLVVAPGPIGGGYLQLDAAIPVAPVTTYVGDVLNTPIISFPGQ